jgi:hypothetical protein
MKIIYATGDLTLVKSSECGSKKKTAGKQAECECV